MCVHAHTPAKEGYEELLEDKNEKYLIK